MTVFHLYGYKSLVCGKGKLYNATKLGKEVSMEQMVKCPICGVENFAGQQFCGKCGAKLATVVAQQPKIKCPNCGTQNAVGQPFCGNCGTKLVATATQQVAVRPAQQAPAVVTQQVPSAPAQQVPAVVPQETPARVARPAAPEQRVTTKPTWGLAWGLWWRWLILTVLIGAVVYLLIVIVMVLGFNYKLPFGA